MKLETMRKKILIFLVVFAAVFLFGSRPAEATPVKYKVVFADSKGKVSSERFRKWACKAEKNTYINLPEVSASGYRYYWVLKTGQKEKFYDPGDRFRVKENTKFYLYRYKLYQVRFYTHDGKREYISKRKLMDKRQSVTLPSVPCGSTYKGIGWTSTVNGRYIRKPGTKAAVTGNMKFYAAIEKTSSVTLRYSNGKLYRRIYTSSQQIPAFPAVGLRNGDMVLGWSREKGKTMDPEYMTGDRIPSKTGTYYMVTFPKESDRKPSGLYMPNRYDRVYWVGDSRTVGIAGLIKKDVSPNVSFICKGSQGLEWFRKTAFKQLYSQVRNRPKQEKKAVIINLGVNDLYNINAYLRVMPEYARKLKAYNCKMYYMSVNPVNSAMMRNFTHRNPYRSEKKVHDFNQRIYKGLCTGKSKTFTYIDCCSYLERKGWISNRYDGGILDGLHYSNGTSLRIYQYGMKMLDKK
ncbi:hypothetical protein [uncultured Blautia sp.]|uniref:hypothetical protein n=1 Tax=uncultured Blautia sp. TaxID=765821 RepID=UPI00280A8294|nr:hypothetical protein [uncultured Blautia sp.]